MRVIPAFFLTSFVFSFSSWIYVVGIQYFRGDGVLRAPLTHYSSVPKVDDFGILCFIIAILSLFLFLVTHKLDKKIEWI